MMSWKVTFSRFCLRNSTRRSKWLASAKIIGFFSCALCPLTRDAPPDSSAVVILRGGIRRAAARRCGARLFGEHRLDLGLERLRVERLDDVVVHAGLLRRDDVLGLGFRRHHDERGLVEAGI